MQEFDLIARYFAPLAGSPEALGLKDDAALCAVPAGHTLVVTTDALNAGVHFLGTESPEAIAHKALAVNLSDLAAMGAEPYGYVLALIVPETINEAWIKSFTQGLREMQDTHHITLLGGDTTLTKGALSLCVTALGVVPEGKALLRSGAAAGDDIYVSGTIGDAALGLRVVKGQAAENEFLRLRYERPTPRLALGQALRGIATSCMDVSDGLVQDIGHICAASKVGATLIWEHIPLSDPARALLTSLTNAHEIIAAGGDDYELLFTAPAEASATIAGLAKHLALPLTNIGRITETGPVQMLGSNQQPLSFKQKGYQHF